MQEALRLNGASRLAESTHRAKARGGLPVARSDAATDRGGNACKASVGCTPKIRPGRQGRDIFGIKNCHEKNDQEFRDSIGF
jgi:hypothetical protein